MTIKNRIEKLENKKAAKHRIIVIDNQEEAPGVLTRGGEVVPEDQIKKWTNDPAIELIKLTVKYEDLKV